MLLRIVTGVRDHFEDRFWEWAGAITTAWWGLKVSGSTTAWTNEEAWRLMTNFFGFPIEENTWGFLFMIVGSIQLLALIINGTFHDTAYAHHSPRVRAITASVSAAMWFLVWMSVLNSGGAGSGIYHLPVVVSLWSMRHAWKDTGRVHGVKGEVNGVDK